ncbi:MAG: hypothetical protein J4F41_04995 [Alphaproteobacteria bacterium]|nr:hypothetical protein [Alphaproteobacteria bacterium]
MEIFSHFKNTFVDGVAGLSSSISRLFEYFISIGIREETLILILIGAGISVLLLIAALMLVLTRVKISKDALKTPKMPKLSRKKKPAKTPAKTKNTAERIKGPNPAFAIFKKRGKTPAAVPVSDDIPPVTGDDLSTLNEIERDMLALKELYETGHIALDVYVQETQTLYNKAKSLA